MRERRRETRFACVHGSASAFFIAVGARTYRQRNEERDEAGNDGIPGKSMERCAHKFQLLYMTRRKKSIDRSHGSFANPLEDLRAKPEPRDVGGALGLHRKFGRNGERFYPRFGLLYGFIH